MARLPADPEPTVRTSRGRLYQIILLTAVAVVFIVIIANKMIGPGAEADGADESPSQSRADAVVAFEQARSSGRPVFVLFHSMTCAPCVEISANVDQVIGSYDGRVAFVNAITDDPSGQRLAADFDFQYIPTSFFIDGQGNLVDSYTGVLSPTDLKARLDRLTGS